MILPTKHLKPERALIGVGAEILRILNQPKTITGLWEEYRETVRLRKANPVGFDRFLLAIDLLYLIGKIDLERGRIVLRGQS